ncbi:hypothetical protein GCM10007160_39080 [Litchfieldella qijiaojingensis]|uniref:Uncharacterized protein n=2 Tax=Litchfieldella qijiaojingensis TaxID=980347 RepID=A0ABQ2Z7X6_9GAMM|nr:hypothetical protein GCM10007160_39080 [Halomonas qijiaojingensis]
MGLPLHGGKCLDRRCDPVICIQCACYSSGVTVMAFHNPDPKMREIEQRNARLRAGFFAKLFGGAWRGFRKALSRPRFRRRRRQP